MKFIKRRSIIICFIGFVIARAEFFQMDPLAIGYFTAAYVEGAGGVLLFLVMAVGIGSVLPFGIAIKYYLAFVAAFIIFESPMMKKQKNKEGLLYIIAPIILCIFSFIEVAAVGWNLDSVALAMLEMVIAYIFAHIFSKGVRYLVHESKGYKMNNEELLSLAFMVAVFIYAVPELGLETVALVKTFVYFLILMFTYKYGVGQGAVAGAVSGFALSFRGNPVSDLGLFTMMGILPAAFREMGRIPTAIIFAITAAMGGAAFEDMALSVQDIGALASAMVIFLLLPGSLIQRVETEEMNDNNHSLAGQNLKKIASTRMKMFSDSFLKLSKTLEVITEKQIKLEQEEINEIFEDISDKLCKNCSKCNDCWEQNFEKTYQSACSMFETAEKNGYISKEDIPSQFMDICISADKYLMETNKGFEIAKLNRIWSNRMAESREVIASQLKEVSTVIQNITGDIYGVAQALHMEEALVKQRLNRAKISVKSLAIVERNNRRKEIHLNAAAPRSRCVTAKEVAILIGEALGVKVKTSEASKTVLSREYDNFVFVEDTKFKVLTGVARTMKEQVSGDNFSLLPLETGECLIALSDGMGTGKDAGDESETVLALLEQLMEAGFRTETAVKLINSSLVLKAEKQSFSTLDLASIDLFTGRCEFTKMGAASAFIKREKWVETISSTTLPIGMLGSADSDTTVKKLYEGDVIIMVTDGVLDSIKVEDKEGYMEEFIAGLTSNNPQEIANQILNHGLEQTDFIPVDDMTVVAIGVWLR